MEKVIYFSLIDGVKSEKAQVPLSSICRLQGADDSALSKAFIEGQPPEFAVTAFEVLEKLGMLYPGYIIVSSGRHEVLVYINSNSKRKSWVFIKTAFLCLVMFTGGAFAIVTFHEDVGMRNIQSGIYRFFTGNYPASPLIIGVPYSIGIALGFIVLLGLIGRVRKHPSNLDLDISMREKSLKDYLSGKFR